MERRWVENLLKKIGVVTTGHFVFKAGDHDREYFNKDAIYSHPLAAYRLSKSIAKQFVDDNIEVVIAPAVGGVILSQWVAYHLSKLTKREVLCTYADKASDEEFVIKRGYEKLIPNKRILVVEDVLTSGTSVSLIMPLVRKLDGIIVGLGVLCNRGEVTAASAGLLEGEKFFALRDKKMESWPEDECPLCANGEEINTNLGKGAAFLQRKGLESTK